nr:glycosyltransferase [uncultured Nocardioides sp.]
MRILHIVNSSDTGGAQTLIEAMCAARLDEQEVHVGVLAAPGALAARLEASASSVTHFGSSGRTSDVVGLVRDLRKLIGRIQPDVVHSHLIQANLLAAIATPRDVAQVWTVHTSGHGTHDKFRTRLALALLDRAFKRADAIVACSLSAGNWMDKRGWTPERISTIRNGVALPVTESGRPATPATPFFLSLARAHEMKDHRTLFTAFDRSDAPNYELVCAGWNVEATDHLMVTALAGLSDDTLQRIHLMGTVAHPQPLLAESRALVISSSYGEALPMAALEALALGVPVITTNVGDCGETAIDSRFLVAPNDPRALAAAMTFVAGADANEYDEFRTAARVAAKRFDIAETVRSYADVYTVVLHAA